MNKIGSGTMLAFLRGIANCFNEHSLLKYNQRLHYNNIISHFVEPLLNNILKYIWQIRTFYLYL